MAAKKRTTESTSNNPSHKHLSDATEAVVPRAAYTVSEFCAAHRISEAMYYKLRAAGLGPREMRAMRKVTISIEAAEQWRRDREQRAQAAERVG